MKINAKYRHITFAFLISVVLTFLLSGVMTYVLRGGFVPDFGSAWMKDWGVAFIIGFALNLYLPAKVRHFTHKFKKNHRFIQIFVTTIINTLIFSFSLTAFNLHGFQNHFAVSWLHAWYVAFTSVFVINLFLPQIIGKFVGRIIAKPPEMHANSNLAA